MRLVPKAPGRLLWIAIAVAIGATVAMLASGGVSRADPTGTYYADVGGSSSTSVAAGSPVTVTIHNCDAADCGADSAADLGSASFTISGAGLQSSVTVASTPAGKTWDASASGDTVTLHADTSGDELAPGESVAVAVTPTTTESTTTVSTEAGSVADNSSYDFTNAKSDPSLKVTPGPLASFTWTTEPGPSKEAGVPFSAAVTAYDAYGNVKTDYGGVAPTGLHDAPNGSQAASYPGTWSNGVLSGEFTDYRTEPGPDGTSLTVTDGSVTASSSSFVVAPGPLDHFDVAPIVSPQKAGTAFSVTATAQDAYGNVDTGYGGGATVTGTLGTSPSGSGPTYGTFGGWTEGQASASVTGYRAEAGDTLTVQDGGAAGTSNHFDIDPGPLASFDWTAEPGPSQQAGVPFTAAVTAYDAYGNVKTDYGGGATLSGLHDAPNGSHAASYPTWSGGVLSGEFTDYRTEPGPEGTSLTVTDGTVAASSSLFVVSPGPLGSYSWTAPPAVTQTAGVAFGATLTAYDLYGNVKTDYEPANSALSGLHSSPSAPSSFPGHPGGFAPNYGVLTWNLGVGTLTGVVDKDAEPASLTFTDGTVNKQSPQFTVNPASPDALAFTQQPTEAQVNTTINTLTSPPGVRVQAIDPFGNLATNTSITIAIKNNAGPGGVLGGTTTKHTDSTGTAVFGDLTINKVGWGYTLVASAPPSSPTATKTSVGFTIAQTVNACTGSSCSGSATIQNESTLAVNASGTAAGNTLGVALAPSAIPSGVCGSFVEGQGLTPAAVNVNYVSGTQPSLVLTWTISKAVRLAKTDNGLAHYNICMGSVNLDDPNRFTGPSPIDPTPGFPVKAAANCPTTRTTMPTACPVWDPIFQTWAFWGVVPDCPAAPATPTGPCMVSRATGTKGVVILTFEVPSPWDPTPHGGT